MSEEHSFTEPILKHLEFIQAVIARQANNSFLVKGWGLTVARAFYLVFRGYAAESRWVSRASGNRSRVCWSG